MSDLSPYVRIDALAFPPPWPLPSICMTIFCRWEGSHHPRPLYRFASIEADGAEVSLYLDDHVLDYAEDGA